MTTDYPIRPPSEQLVDLHVYLLPREVWNEKYGSTYNESITEARSAGFVRVWPDLTVCGLRTVIEDEIGDSLPQNYVFLRSVGRCMTQIKPKQELELKCKAFLPPTAWAPEIVVLEATRDSMSVPMYQSFPGYSPRHDATQPINGIPTHFPQVANHDRMAPQSDGLGKESKIVLETSQEKAQDKTSADKTKIAKSKEKRLARGDKATSRLAKKGEARPVLGNKKTAGTKAPQSEAGLERTKRLRQAQAAWFKEAKRSKISEVQKKAKETLVPIRDRKGRVRRVETGGLEKDLGGGNGQIEAMRKTYSGRRMEGKMGQESTRTSQRPQGRVIEIPVSKADRLGRLLQDRTVQTYIGMIVPSHHNTHPPLVPGDSPTMHSTSVPGQRLPPASIHHPNPPHPPQLFPTHNANLTNSSFDSAQRSNHNHPVAVHPDSNYGPRRTDNPITSSNTSANNSASFSTVQPLPLIAHHTPDVLVVKSQSGSHPQQSTLKNTKKSHPISSNSADPSNTQSNSDDGTNQVVADVASPTNKRTTNNASPGEDVAQDTAPATTGLRHHTNNLHHHHHLHNNIHQSGSRRLSHNDPNSVSFPAPLSATPPDTPTSDTPPPGQSPMVQQQQQQGYKGDPLQSIVGMPGKSGRPDAYTNNTNEDSGIAEPTPDDDDPDYERRKSDIDDQYYNQLHPDQTQKRQFGQTERTWDESDRYQEKEIEEERQRQEEIQQREEERRKEEERIEVERQREEERREERREVERQREEDRREHDRKLEQKRQEEVKKKRQREMEERRKEEEKMKEEMKQEEEAERQRVIAERIREATFDRVMPLSEGDEEYNDATIAMETNQAPDSRGHFLNDEQMRRRAEEELQDYEPQSTWRKDGGGEMGYLRHPGRRNRSREDTEMEIASQQAVQDGLKRVHLTPEVHRKAKIGKIRNNSVTDEEDIYETDPEMADLLEQLQAARQERVKKEKERENLIKRAKDLQTKTHERRNRSLNESRPRSNSVTPDLATRPRDYWKKRYYDEKKKTAPMEEQVSRVRNQIDQMHRKLLSHMEGKKKGVSIKGPPSKKNDHKINILKMQHELDEIKRKVDKSRMKLTSEIKLRNQAEDEVRGLKSEVSQRKINTTLIRNQKLAALKMGDNKLLSKTPIPALGKGPLSFSAKR